MTLPIFPNPISLSQIRDEFGIKAGVTQPKISDYYAGGGLVRPGTVGYPGGVQTPIPSSGPIALSNFFGAKKVTLNENFAQYFASLNTNARMESRYDTSYMVVSTKTQQYLYQAPYSDGDNGSTAAVWYNLNASKSIAWRTAAVTQADYNAMSLSFGKSNGGRAQSVKNLYAYSDFIPLSEGDILYYLYGVNSDEYGYCGFYIYDLETRTAAQVSSVGGDCNTTTSGQTRAWMYAAAGIRVINGALDTKIFSGKKIIMPYWRGIQVGSWRNLHSQYFGFVHAINPFGDNNINGKTGLPDRGAAFQRMFIHNTTGLASPYPEVFEVNNNVMTVKADIIVTVLVDFSSNNSAGFAPEATTGSLAFPASFPIYRRYTNERYSEYVPYIVKAGTYTLPPNLVPLYNPTIYVL